jgi:hypothetical protein
MLNCGPPPPADRLSLPMIPLPIALYVSRGLTFELYDGGQPRRTFSIRWEWVVPRSATSQSRIFRVPNPANATGKTSARPQQSA